ncbi:MAG: ferritin-like domain-containing protein [Caulobacteraceae bacterium]
MDDTLIQEALSRRESRRLERCELFRWAGLAAGAAGTMALTACGGGHSTSTAVAPAATTTTPTDADVLNFALNLEYLESNFYAFATTGAGIPASYMTGTGTQGAATGGQAVPFSSPLVQRVANDIAKDELNHVAFLRSQLGTSAVSQPTLDLSVSATSAFSLAAQAAGLVPAGTAFNPYADDESFLLAAYLFEDVGVTAYIGGSTLIANKTYLEAAAGILATEAVHASTIRTTLYALGVNGPSLGVSAVAIDPFASTSAISAARAKLDGTNSDDIGIGSATSPTVVDADQSTAIVPARTPAQVLNIVYLNASAVSAGGFFPSGVNGNVRTSG